MFHFSHSVRVLRLLALLVVLLSIASNAFCQTVEAVLRGVQERQLVESWRSGGGRPIEWTRPGGAQIAAFPADGAITNLQDVLYALNKASEAADGLRLFYIAYDSYKARPVEFRHERSHTPVSTMQNWLGILDDNFWMKSFDRPSIEQMADGSLRTNDYIREVNNMAIGENGTPSKVVFRGNRDWNPSLLLANLFDDPIYSPVYEPELDPPGVLHIFGGLSGTEVAFSPLLLASVGRFDESNWKTKLRALASMLDQMVALPWATTSDGVALEAGIILGQRYSGPLPLKETESLAQNFGLFGDLSYENYSEVGYVSKRIYSGERFSGMQYAITGGTIDGDGNAGFTYLDANGDMEVTPYNGSGPALDGNGDPIDERLRANSGEGYVRSLISNHGDGFGFTGVIGTKLQLRGNLSSTWSAIDTTDVGGRLCQNSKGSLFKFPSISAYGDLTEDSTDTNVWNDTNRLRIGNFTRLNTVPSGVDQDRHFRRGQLERAGTRMGIYWYDENGQSIVVSGASGGISREDARAAVLSFLDIPVGLMNFNAESVRKKRISQVDFDQRLQAYAQTEWHFALEHIFPEYIHDDPAETADGVLGLYWWSPEFDSTLSPGKIRKRWGLVDPFRGDLYQDPLKRVFLEMAVGVSSVMEPGFTKILPASAKMAPPRGVPGSVHLTTDHHDLYRVYLGRGIDDMNLDGWLTSRNDGFGSMHFQGSPNSDQFELLYETDPKQYEAPLDDERTYNSARLFTGQESAQSGFPDRDSYITKWFEPRLRQVRSKDVLADVKYINPYEKEIRFFWASDLADLQNGEKFYGVDEARAFKIVRIKNTFYNADSGLPAPPGGIPPFTLTIQETGTGEAETIQHHVKYTPKPEILTAPYTEKFEFESIAGGVARSTIYEIPYTGSGYQDKSQPWIITKKLGETVESITSVMGHFNHFDYSPNAYEWPAATPDSVTTVTNGPSVTITKESFTEEDDPDPAPWADTKKLSISGGPDDGKVYEFDWDGRLREVTFPLAGKTIRQERTLAGNTLTSKTYIDGQESAELKTVFSKPEGMEQLTIEELTYNDVPVTTTTYRDPSEANFAPTNFIPWSTKSVLYPGGHKFESELSGNANGITSKVTEKWGSDVYSVSNSRVNAFGGLVSSDTTVLGVKVSELTGHDFTDWGIPKKLVDLRGAQQVTEFKTSGPQWGFPTQVTSFDGVTSGIAFDAESRVSSITGINNVDFDYTDPNQLKSIYQTHTETQTFSPLGEFEKFHSTFGSGTTVDRLAGELKVGNRTKSIGMDVSSIVTSTGDGLGSRGARMDFGFQGGKFYTSVFVKKSGIPGEFPEMRTVYDALGRIVSRQGVGPDNSPVTESWNYDDANRKVTYTPGMAPVVQSVSTSLSANGRMTTVSVGGRDMSETEVLGSNGRLIVQNRVNDDSSGSGMVLAEETSFDPATGVTISTPWNLAGAQTTITTQKRGESREVNVSHANTSDNTKITIQHGLVHNESVTANGVNISHTPNRSNGVLKSVSSFIGGDEHTKTFDRDVMLATASGPGYNRNFSRDTINGAQNGQDYRISYTDPTQVTSGSVDVSAIGITQRIADGRSMEIRAPGQDTATGRKTTLNENLEIETTHSGEVVKKTYAGGADLTESYAVNSDGSLKNWSISDGQSSIGATIVQTPTKSTSTFHDGAVHETNFYHVGLRKDVSAPNDGRTFSYKHFALEKETHTTGPLSGWKVDYVPDTSGRLWKIIATSPTQQTREFVFGYDDYARLEKSTVADFTATLSRDGKARPDLLTRGQFLTDWVFETEHKLPRLLSVEHTSEIVGARRFQYNFTHDERHRIKSRTPSDGTTWSSLNYDAIDQLKEVTLSGSELRTYNYDWRGNRIDNNRENNVPNGMDRLVSQSLAHRGFVLAGQSGKPGASIYAKHQFTNDQWLQFSNISSTGKFIRGWDVPLIYNGGNPVFVEAKIKSEYPNRPTVERKTYVTVPATAVTFAYDAAGRLKDDGVWIYTWDNAGRLTQRERTPQARPAWMLSDIISYQYDADDRRTQRTQTVVTSGAQGAPPETRVNTSKVLWAGWLPIREERTENGAPLPVRWFQWGPDLSGTLEGAGGIGGLMAIHEENAAGGIKRTLIPAHDGLGNITAVYEKVSGIVVAQYDYGPYGEPLGEYGDTEVCPFRWQTKWYESESQQYYFGYRYYDPRTGRWLSRDPLGEAGGFNLYSNCGNDPVNKHDPLGLADWTTVTRAREAEFLMQLADQTGDFGDMMVAYNARRSLLYPKAGEECEPWTGAIFKAYGSLGLARYVGARDETLGMIGTTIHGGMIVGQGVLGYAMMVAPEPFLTKAGGGILLTDAADQMHALFSGKSGYRAALEAIYGEGAEGIDTAVSIKNWGLAPLTIGSGFSGAYRPMNLGWVSSSGGRTAAVIRGNGGLFGMGVKSGEPIAEMSFAVTPEGMIVPVPNEGPLVVNSLGRGGGGTAAERTLALPAPRQVAANWGVNTYRHGGEMYAIEHIMHRHGANSGFTNVSRFAEGTGARQIQSFVDDALRYGRQTAPGTFEYNFGRAIGTNQGGGVATGIRVHIRNGNIQTAFPITIP